MELVFLILSLTKRKVSKAVYNKIIFIVESYKLLLDERAYFYKYNYRNKNSISIVNLEKTRLKNLSKSKSYDLNQLYYSLDGHNIFKRLDRYYLRKTNTIFFLLLTIYNISEIGLNISFFMSGKHSNEYKPAERIVTVFSNMTNMILTQIISYLTISKLDIKTYIFY